MSDDTDRATQLISDALDIESTSLAPLPEDLAGRSPAARPHHRRMTADRDKVLSLMSPFISFTDPVLAVIALGASLIVLAAMLYVAVQSHN